ncbi:MAG: CYTH domain-containing protein [Clostridiales bacterium]|jgi:triphosphatase|nr:CYTH domain-containing protein [Clostridiales bacterium]
MEIELKFTIKDKQVAEEIWEDPYLEELGEVDSKETVYMKAAYFDTEDHILSKNDIAFRIRMEGNRIIASLKWNGSSEEGLHIREEVNVPVDDPACFLQPSPDIFKESEQGKIMMDLVGDKVLNNLLEMHFIRRRIRVDTQNSIVELAIDTGEIITNDGTLPICELEIELFSGEEGDLQSIGETLAEKYELSPLNESKYARGLKFLNYENN